MAASNGPNEQGRVETPEDERLPPVPGPRYSAFDAAGGTTVVLDREVTDAWLRADNAVEVRR